MTDKQYNRPRSINNWQFDSIKRMSFLLSLFRYFLPSFLPSILPSFLSSFVPLNVNLGPYKQYPTEKSVFGLSVLIVPLSFKNKLVLAGSILLSFLLTPLKPINNSTKILGKVCMV